MKVCVTGSEGFLGKHVIKALKAAGHTVACLDVSPQAEIVADITKIMPLMKVDAVIHLAAMANPRDCDADPTRAFNTNVNGTHQVLRLALESGARKFVFSSSAHVYGISPKYLPTDERHPLWLQNTYTTTKILGEQLCHLFYENHGLSYTNLRLFNAYGPGQAGGYFVPDMILKARNGEVQLKGGNTTKDFVFVDDVAHAFCLAVGSSYVGPLNIGTGLETPLDEVARWIAHKAGVKFYNWDQPDNTRMQADSTRAKAVLGWEPRISLQKGLYATLRAAEKVAV